jgi:secreted PhoX family phosphatase
MKKSSAPFEKVLQAFVDRRQLLRGAGALAAASAVSACSKGSSPEIVNDEAAAKLGKPSSSTLSFAGLEHGLDQTLTVAEGYEAKVLVRWGDPIFADAPAFDPENQSAATQAQQFGYNNDFIGFIPFEDGESNHGLLVVNHEYSNMELMDPSFDKVMTPEQIELDMVATGMSVVEVELKENAWQLVLDSKYNRRITAHTPMQITGPAAGSERLKTIMSKDGVQSFGTYSNCAGGVTPWGTILSGEENVDYYFYGDPYVTDESESYKRFDFSKNSKPWGKYHERWNLQSNPREPMHVGWVVEIDPFDPNSKPKKRTALGHCKHEGCNVFINSDGRVVAYTGDDEQFEYIYKFISRDRFDPENPQANKDFLDEGTLYAARFESNGELHWLPLIYGQGPLTQANGFHSQADVCIDSRKAADLLGATPMDRPEDVEVNPHNGHVYAMLTNNVSREPSQIDAANPRAHNGFGQIIDFWPENSDHASDSFNWDIFILAGNPEATQTKYHPSIDENGWLSCPDNCAFDSLGNLWIATDGGEKSGIADGVWATEVSGPNKALTKRFLRTPVGAELCGPFFTPDNETLFVAVQHPGDKSEYEKPFTRWPDFDQNLPPRPSVVAIRKIGGGRVGS